MKSLFIFIDQVLFKILFLLFHKFRKYFHNKKRTSNNNLDSISNNSTKDKKTLLIIKWYGLGDLILLTKTMNAFKNAGYDITLFTSNKMFFNKDNFPQIKTVYKLSLNPITLLKILRKINSSRFDVIFDAEQWSYFSAFLRLFMKSKSIVSFDTPHLKKHLGSDICIKYNPNFHESEQFFKIAKVLLTHKNIGDVKCSIKVNSNSKETLKKYNLSNKKYIIIHPLTLNKSLNFNLVRYFILAKNLIDKGYVVVFTGTKSDSIKLKKYFIHRKHFNDIKYSNNFKNLFFTRFNKINLDDLFEKMQEDKIRILAGKTSLDELFALTKNASYFIAQSTGVMHASCVLGTKTICITTQTNPLKWGVLKYNKASKNILPHILYPNFLYLFTKKNFETNKFKRLTNFNDIDKLIEDLNK